MFKRTGLLLVGLVFIPGLLSAAGDSAMPQTPSAISKTPKQMAVDEYNSGLRRQKAALKLEEKASKAKPEDRKKLEAKIRKSWEAAIEDFSDAVMNDPSLYQAHSGLGHAYRKAGNYEASLQAYERSLEIEPRYAEAIEYRAEAYLGLNRLEEAKQAYMLLFTGDRARADELASAMKRWVEMRRTDPAGVAPETVEQFATWLNARQELASQNTSVQSKDAPRSW